MTDTTDRPIPPEHALTRPRLPLREEVAKRFNLTPPQWNALVNSIYPAAKSLDAMVMVLSYCQARKLDVFKRPVHIVPMWDSKRRCNVDSVWPGIAEIRTTATRTNVYAGCDETAFGPEKTETFEGMVGYGDKREKKEVTVTFPEWCQITVYRLVGNHRVAFVGPKVYWLETYASYGGTNVPNAMWERRARGQIEKCAEAAALRKAFPEELSGVLAAEEMAGREIHGHDISDWVEHEPKAAPEPEKQAEAVQNRLDSFGRGAIETETTETATIEVEDAEIVVEERPKATKKAAPKKGIGGAIYTPDESGARLDSLCSDLKAVDDEDGIFGFIEIMRPIVDRMVPEHQKLADTKLKERASTLLGEGGEELSFFGG